MLLLLGSASIEGLGDLQETGPLWWSGSDCGLLAFTMDPLDYPGAVSYTHLRAHETPEHLVCRLLLEKKNQYTIMRANNTI